MKPGGLNVARDFSWEILDGVEARFGWIVVKIEEGPCLLENLSLS